MPQDRASLESQQDVIADVLCDTYLPHFRDLLASLTAPPVSTVPVSNPIASKTVKQSYAIAPGVSDTVTYGLNGANDLTPSPNLLLWGGLALGAYLMFGKK